MAGMYIGELVQYILRDLCKQGIIFTEDALSILDRPGNYDLKLRAILIG